LREKGDKRKEKEKDLAPLLLRVVTKKKEGKLLSRGRVVVLFILTAQKGNSYFGGPALMQWSVSGWCLSKLSKEKIRCGWRGIPKVPLSRNGREKGALAISLPIFTEMPRLEKRGGRAGGCHPPKPPHPPPEGGRKED